MPVVNMPDGTAVRFPDEMPSEQIQSLIAQKFPEEVGKLEAPQQDQESDAIGALKQGFKFSPFGLPAAVGRAAGQYIREEWENPPQPSMLAGVKTAVKAFTDPIPPYSLGTRREDYTDIPPPSGPTKDSTWLGRALGMPPVAARPTDPMTDRGMDIAVSTMLGSAGGAARRGVNSSALGMNFVPRGATPAGGAGRDMLTPAAQEVVDRATNIGVPLPRYMVDENRTTQGLAAGLQNIPGAGDKIAKAATDTAEALGAAAGRIREGYGAGSRTVAGSEAKEAVSSWITDSSKKVAERVYGEVDRRVNPDITTDLSTTAKAAQSILARREASKIPGNSTAVEIVREAIEAPGGLNYEGIKGLRSYLGEMTDQEIISQGLKSGEVKLLYSALTQDLRAAAKNAGGDEALKAFDKANSIFSAISERREQVAKIIGSKGDLAPEAVFERLAAMAGSKSSADVAKLAAARKVIGPEAWDQVASAVIARLGRDAQGDFSITRFLGPNGYPGLSDGGKSILFRSTNKGQLAQQLDDLAFVSRNIEQKLKQFYNPSGTGKSLVATSTVYGIIRHPIETLAVMLGGGRMAGVLSEPVTARATADWLRALDRSMTAPHQKATRAVRRASEQLAKVLTSKGGGNPQMLAIQLQNALTPREQGQ